MKELQLENDKLKAQIERVRDALCPSSLGTDMATWDAIVERQERHVFNEAKLGQALGRSDGQTVMIIWMRYKDALAALNGGEDEQESI